MQIFSIDNLSVSSTSKDKLNTSISVVFFKIVYETLKYIINGLSLFNFWNNFKILWEHVYIVYQ